MKSVVEKDFFNKFAFNNKELKTFVECFKLLVVECEFVENVRSSNVVEFEFELRHIPSTNALPLCQTTTTTYLLTYLLTYLRSSTQQIW